MSTPFVESDRLILRQWKTEDLDAFARMNADPRVMEFFPAVMNRDEVQNMMHLLQERIDKQGFSFWAAELKSSAELIGFIGLNTPGYPLPFAPCVEVGWRLAYEHWNRGYAQEGARACLKYGFEKIGLHEIVSFTAVENRRSRHVMERIGMSRDEAGDFDHPKLAEGHPLRRHVLYRLSKDRYLNQSPT